MNKKVQGKLTNFFKKPELTSKISNDLKQENIKCNKRKRTSPCKSPQKNIKIDPNFDNLDSFFEEDFIFDDFKENLNLNKLQRYEVLRSEVYNNNLKLQVKSLLDPLNSGTCCIKPPWNEYRIKQGDIVSIKGSFKDEWVVEWDGLFVLNSDNLLSTTQIVGSLYCTRKTILSSIFDEIGEFNSELLVLGCVVHELLQEVLRKKCSSIEDINNICEDLIKDGDFIVRIFMEKMDYNTTIIKIKSFVPKICDFVSRYVSYGKIPNLPFMPDNWSGEIESVKDIEENVWSPTLGIKGKIDATVLVKVKNKTKIMPLELKTGKVSFSLEHRGQVILYCMLLKELGEFVDSGLLLYLKDEGGIKEIQAAEREIRDLTLLRNGLSFFLEKIDNINVSDPVPKLPPPINRKSCLNCGHLISCSSALRLDGLENLKDNVLTKLAPEVTSHLTQTHLDYIFKMVALQSMENNTNKSSISRVWSFPSDKREENGWCVSNMEVVSSQFYKNGKFQVTYKKSLPINHLFTVGQTIIVNQNDKYALTLGFVQSVEKHTITILQDKFMKPGTDNIQLDSYESNSILNSTRANFGLLLQNTPVAQSIRESIIDKKIPKFLPKLSSKVKKLGQDIMEPLNREQCRAVLQALTAERYILIKGMAGTGKTTTIGALIQLLVKLGKRVLITSYTNSAVDNILIKLTGLSILRIGSKIHPSLLECSEKNIISKLKSPSVEKLEKLYSSFNVVGVTCHGANHRWLQRQEFDYCLVDEATQATQAVVLRPIFLAKKFILIGDPNQLPPLVINEDAKKLGLGESLFKRLDRPAVTTVLKQQYRMNIKINDLANNFVYGGDLKCGNDQIAQSTLLIPKIDPNIPDWLQKITSDQIQHSVILLDVRTEIQCTNINHTEAEIVKEILLQFKKLGFNNTSIGVISTYKEQVNLLQNTAQKILDVEVNTVDQYQGRDKDIIIYSASKNSKYNPKDITSDVHRLTVAITRAKKKLILICDKEFVLKYDNFKKLIQGIDQENIIKK